MVMVTDFFSLLKDYIMDHVNVKSGAMNNFLVDETDLDLPIEGFASIEAAIEDIRNGKMVLVVDDEHREYEEDLVMAASKVTPHAMSFFVRYCTGIVCVSMKEEDLERQHIPLKVDSKENEEKLTSAFNISGI